jgi:hypothetical protein
MKIIHELKIVLLLLATACTGRKVESIPANEERHDRSIAVDYADSMNSGLIPVDTLKGSPVREVTEKVGGNQIHIKYGSPGVRGRAIWGELVPYDKVWVTGAHHATAIEFSHEVTIGEKKSCSLQPAFRQGLTARCTLFQELLEWKKPLELPGRLSMTNGILMQGWLSVT